MKCANCGAELVEGGKFCGSCGSPVTVQPAPEQTVRAATPQAQEYVQQMAAQQQTEGVPLKKSVWSLILGCAGLGSFWTGFLGPFGIISIIISIIGLVIGIKAKKENPENKMGKTGRILCIIGLIVVGVMMIISTFVWVEAFKSGKFY